MFEGFLVAQKVGGGASTILEMVPAPPQGERDRGRPEAMEAESTIAESKKDKGKAVLNAQPTNMDGEGCSGTRKEEVTNQGAKRIGKCVLKSKTIP